LHPGAPRFREKEHDMIQQTRHPIGITDVTLRDGHQSLMATRLRMEHMLPVLEKMDKVGFHSLEVWGGATFDSCMRFLDEDPWERLRIIRKHCPNTKLQMLLRGQNVVGYRNYADDVVDAFVEKGSEYGMDIWRIFDALNDTRNMRRSFMAVKKAGKHAQGTISYTTSPVHTIEKFTALARELADLGSDSICIKDMAGQIFPRDVFDLVKAIKDALPDMPVQIHSHSFSGMAPVAYYAAAEAGADVVDCSFSALGWGTSLPPTESIIGAFKGTPFDTGIDIAGLQELTDYFDDMVIEYKDIIQAKSLRIDPRILMHQIPGGMFSNMLSQLKEMGASDKLDEVLKEVPRVREDLGYPPLVTPTSQIVGTQATMNIIMGGRYKNIIKEVVNYLKGMYGRPPGEVNPEVLELALKGEKPIDCRPADMIEPELEKNRTEAESKGARPGDMDDLIAYTLFPQVAPDFFKKREQHSKEAEHAQVVAAAVGAYQNALNKSAARRTANGAAAAAAASPWATAGRMQNMGMA
jgi:pyruvate carboxylase subunit B